MLRRCVRELSSARSLGRRPRVRPITAQSPFFLSSRNEFSSGSAKSSPQKPVPPEETSGSGISKLLIGIALSGAAGIAAYQTGYLNLHVKDEKSPVDNVQISKNSGHADIQETIPIYEKPSVLKPNIDAETTERDCLKDLGASHETPSEIKPAEDTVPSTENELSSFPVSSTSTLDEKTSDSKISPEGTIDNNARPASEEISSLEESPKDTINDNARPAASEEISSRTNSILENQGNEDSIPAPEKTDMMEATPHQDAAMETPKDPLKSATEEQKPLADSYSLNADEGASGKRESTDALAAFLNNKEDNMDFVRKSENTEDKNKPDDEKVLLDLIEAIHAAERRQAETDAYIFAEEKRKLKENYEKKLKDARARELMYAEEAAILEKELNKEKAKAAAAIKSLQEKAEQKLQEELRRKEEEADIQLKKAQDLAKAELAAAIAQEKASQIEKIAEANLNINALCIAFYARSEEARQTHSVHKLALGTLALEDAISKGLPIRGEVDALYKSLEGIDRDSLLDLALSSLPEEALHYGIDTHMQLNQKFDSLKGTLRHFSLIPAGGGGLLAHTVAHIASSIKMKEDQSGDGIESVITQVEHFLVEGKFAEAADALEGGVCGSQAEEVIVEWVRQARNRAVVEQALSLLQSYATSISFT